MEKIIRNASLFKAILPMFQRELQKEIGITAGGRLKRGYAKKPLVVKAKGNRFIVYSVHPAAGFLKKTRVPYDVRVRTKPHVVPCYGGFRTFTTAPKATTLERGEYWTHSNRSSNELLEYDIDAIGFYKTKRKNGDYPDVWGLLGPRKLVPLYSDSAFGIYGDDYNKKAVFKALIKALWIKLGKSDELLEKEFKRIFEETLITHMASQIGLRV